MKILKDKLNAEYQKDNSYKISNLLTHADVVANHAFLNLAARKLIIENKLTAQFFKTIMNSHFFLGGKKHVEIGLSYFNVYMKYVASSDIDEKAKKQKIAHLYQIKGIAIQCLPNLTERELNEIQQCFNKALEIAKEIKDDDLLISVNHVQSAETLFKIYKKLCNFTFPDSLVQLREDIPQTYHAFNKYLDTMEYCRIHQPSNYIIVVYQIAIIHKIFAHIFPILTVITTLPIFATFGYFFGWLYGIILIAATPFFIWYSFENKASYYIKEAERYDTISSKPDYLFLSLQRFWDHLVPIDEDSTLAKILKKLVNFFIKKTFNKYLKHINELPKSYKKAVGFFNVVKISLLLNLQEEIKAIELLEITKELVNQYRHGKEKDIEIKIIENIIKDCQKKSDSRLKSNTERITNHKTNYKISESHNKQHQTPKRLEGNKMRYSELKKELPITDETWVVSLARLPKTKNHQHAFIVLEGKENGIYKIWFIDLVRDIKGENLYGLKGLGKIRQLFHTCDSNNKGLLFSCNLKMMSIRKGDQIFYSSWSLGKNQADMLLDSVKIDFEKNDLPKEQRIKFHMFGKGNITTWSSSSADGHNCFTWAREKLRELEHKEINASLQSDLFDVWIAAATNRCLKDPADNRYSMWPAVAMGTAVAVTVVGVGVGIAKRVEATEAVKTICPIQ